MDSTHKVKDIWYNLDNAANIFPAISDDRNTNVFRLSWELTENIDVFTLQKALDIAMKNFGSFQVVMRRGLFWFYLERTGQQPVVTLESGRPCQRLFYISRKELLFSVTYYQNRINLEVFHSVSDGAGALQLLREIVCQYIILAHSGELPQQPPPFGKQSHPSQQAEDSFSHYYDPGRKKAPSPQRAYTIGGTVLPGNGMKIICGTLSSNQMRALAKSAGVSVTAYLAALMLCAVYRELMPARSRGKPIGINIPVDLRNHFPSETARNFFSVLEVVYNFSTGPDDFESVLASVAEQLKAKTKPDSLALRMNYTTGVQRNIFARAVPLVLKNWVLRAAYHRSEHATTCALSNLGPITMPEPYAGYIDNFSCLLNPTPIHRLKACVASFGDKFVINFTSCIAETKAQRYFFRHLSGKGLDVCITCNGVDSHEIL